MNDEQPDSHEHPDQETLAEYIDHRLDGLHTAIVSEHLLKCLDCALLVSAAQTHVLIKDAREKEFATRRRILEFIVAVLAMICMLGVLWFIVKKTQSYHKTEVPSATTSPPPR